MPNKCNKKDKTSAQRFTDMLTKRKNPHILTDYRDPIENYSIYQEQQDLRKYIFFINSSFYDDIIEAESKIKKLVI